MQRRSMLKAALLAAAAPVALAACTSTTGTTPAQVFTDLSTFAGGLVGAFGQLASTATVTIPTAVTTALADLQAAAANFATNGATIVTAQPIIQQIGTYVTTLFSFISSLGAVIPNPISMAFAAAQILWPIIWSGVQLAFPAAGMSALKRALPTIMDPNDARNILNGFKH